MMALFHQATQPLHRFVSHKPITKKILKSYHKKNYHKPQAYYSNTIPYNAYHKKSRLYLTTLSQKQPA